MTTLRARRQLAARPAAAARPWRSHGPGNHQCARGGCTEQATPRHRQMIHIALPAPVSAGWREANTGDDAHRAKRSCEYCPPRTRFPRWAAQPLTSPDSCDAPRLPFCAPRLEVERLLGVARLELHLRGAAASRSTCPSRPRRETPARLRPTASARRRRSSVPIASVMLACSSFGHIFRNRPFDG